MPFVPTADTGQMVPRGSFEGLGERVFMHNLAANPEAAKRYLASLGNEVRSYGTDWNFAYRKAGSDGPWRPAASTSCRFRWRICPACAWRSLR